MDPKRVSTAKKLFHKDNNNTKLSLIVGTRFRPLSLDIPKPLFPVAGRPIIQHHIEACVQLKDLKEILIIGYYPVPQMEQFIKDMHSIYDDVSIRYVSLDALE